jgi:alpha-ketoglutarate-dependent taurine dioxygenase
LLRLSDSEHLALLTLHHIVTDGWSMAVLVREVAALYEAFSRGEDSPLPELPVQYADYAAWQREFLRGEVLEEQLSYWKGALAGAPRLELPADRPRPAAQSFRGAYEPVFVPLSLVEKLRAMGEAEGVTPFMTLLAVFNLMLSYYAKQDDIVVGTDVANRNRSEVENLLGFFINQLVLRTDLSGDPTFRELLGRVRAVTLDAYAHQETPFDLLVDAVKPERTLSHAPLFQSKFVLQSTPQETLELPGLTLKLLGANYVSAKLDLTLLLEETPEGFRGNIEYSTDLFERATAARLAKWFVTLLEEALAQPDRRIGELKSRLRAVDRRGRDADDGAIENLQLKKLRSIRPKKVELAREELVVKDLLRGGEAMPLVVRPLSEEVDAVSWAAGNRPSIEKDLREHGAILFRDFKIDLSAQLESFARSLCTELFNENGEHPRELVSGNVYTPVFYPPDQHLLWHNENSFNYRWPTKIWFACVQPAREGGETPVVDSRKVFARLSPGVRDSFMKKGVMYTRNYDKALGLEWQTVFQTTDRAQVEKYCRLNSIEFEWKANGELRTRCVRPAAIRHPQTGVWSWFNQAQHWHTSCLDLVTRESMLRLFAEEDLPRNCYYGDGSPIEDSVMMEILEVYRGLEVSFPWQKGDIMMLDNVLTAHARNRFAGTRKLLVALGDMLSYGEVADSPGTL